MEIIRTVIEMQAEADRLRAAGRRLALVPTMGSLHAGHMALIEAARRQGDHVTVSIFVNPTQFGPGEDFERYPRDLEGDLARIREAGGADAVFAPTTASMYPDGATGLTWVTVDRLGDHLCGARRPGHFRGVTTVVAKLFHACRPHVAVFGLKDAQQFFILRRMVEDLDFGIRMVGVPTVRERDGLALSSRNRYLSAEERAQAHVLYRAVSDARDRILAGERDPRAVVDHLRRVLGSATLGRIDYAEVVEARRLEPVDRLEAGATVIAAVAVFFGSARLIDNAIVEVPAA